MKAVFLLQTDPFLPKPALRALREADSLARAGWKIVFVSWIKGDTPPPDDLTYAYPVRRVSVPVPRLGTSLVKRALAYRRAIRGLSDAAVAEGPDLLVAHDFEVLPAGAIAKRGLGRPLIYDSHEDWPALIAENSRVESLLAGIQEPRLCRRVDHVVTVSEPIADKFRAWGRPTTVLYNARPSSEVRLTDRGPARSHFGYDPQDFVLGYAGAFGRGRGLETLLAAAARLPSQVKALFVGGPEDEVQRLRDLVLNLGLSARVRIDGYRPFSELAPYYAAMDLGVILPEPWPNHLRAMPNKLFDYMAHGVPVLAPDYPAMGPIVRGGPCGWTVRDVRWESVSVAIQEARASGATGDRGRVGRDRYLREYAWERQAEDFLRIVATLTGAREA